MTCRPQDFLTLAQKLSNSEEEIERRCAISRAYYAALHLAIEAKEKCPPIHADTHRGGSHEATIQRYAQHTSSTSAMKVGYVLRSMRNKRESADYDLSGICLASDVTLQIKDAQRIAEFLKAI